MTAQTNIQLYAQLIDANWSAAELALVRAAYDQATQLFAGCFRASGRPFVCHLVGTASLLAAWRQPPAVVAAGLLHSAYLYGDFADGARRTKSAHRTRLTAAVGAPTESLVFDFCQARREDGFTRWLAEPHNVSSADHPSAILLLADLADDCAGGEPCYAPHKQYEAGLPWEPAARAQAVELAQVVLGSVAANELQARFAALDTLKIPAALQSSRSGFQRMAKPSKWRRITQRLGNLLPLIQPESGV